MKNVLVIIPARGGSKGIPRKNVRLMDGHPLISYAINNAINSKYETDVIVSTDDDEIERISRNYGAEIVKRPEVLATDKVTLDPVIYHAFNEFSDLSQSKYDAVVTMQPTSPLLKSSTLDRALDAFFDGEYDTILSAINKPHLSWTEENGEYIPLYEKRLNRQELPKNLIETGAFVITRSEYVTEKSRFGPKLSLFEVPGNESIDIDHVQDWWVAEKELSKKKILIRTDGYSEIGTGHIYRCLMIAYKLIDHDIKIVLNSRSDIGIEMIKKSYIPYEVIDNDNEIVDLIDEFNCDIVINDILDTDVEYIREIKKTGVRVVNFEDLGPGADLANVVINDLYEKQREGDNYFWGSKYYCLRDEFLLANPALYREEVRNVLILFGGTDPSELTMKVFDSIVSEASLSGVKFTFILGMGYKNVDEIKRKVEESGKNIEVIQNVKLMTEYMKRADLAISSQGRTMLELAAMNVPTILLAQNKRELHHEFGYLKNGFINLGLGKDVDSNTIRETILWLIKSPQIRMQIKNMMSENDLKKGIDRVIQLIIGDLD